MNFFLMGLVIMQAARLACGTCVFESDFGFALNCNFKKSGLFRVRNLGGLKAHFGLGFSLGDELGFPESLGNLEGGRRRAISYKNGPPNLVGVLPATQQTVPLQQHPIPDKRITSRSTGSMSYNPQLLHDAMKKQMTSAKTSKKMQSGPKPLMTEARPLPLGVPVFRPIPKNAPAVPVTPSRPKTQQPAQFAQRRTSAAVAVDAPNQRITLNNKLVESYSQPVHYNRTFHVANPTVSQPDSVPAFQAMPSSISQIADKVRPPTINTESRIMHKHPNYLQFEEPKFDLKDVTVEELAAAANVSVDTIKHAIFVREQQLKAEHRAMLAAKLREEFVRTSTTTTSTSTTTTTTTTARPFVYIEPVQIDSNSLNIDQNIAHENKVSKVMNAPKEYYPVGYDKDFDDNFKSKVDLPPTSFACGKQKHFPGLYADTDLGCMVFHVCALTDDGLVRKSFLCPENTLFDQTILKCNWWFYVDCSASKSVYDSNIPISKSYQLMKSLTYFSKYNKNKDNDANGNDGGLDIQTLTDSMAETSRKLETKFKDNDESLEDSKGTSVAKTESTSVTKTESSTVDTKEESSNL